METTIAFTRMFLSGVFDRYPRLKVLIAHAGGTIPFLAGRVESCVQHERAFPPFTTNDVKERRGPKRSLEEVLRENVWLDAVVYGETGVRAAEEVVGKGRVLFGTDHPFFPPLEEGGERRWKSVDTNVTAVGGDEGVMGRNAVKLLGLEWNG